MLQVARLLPGSLLLQLLQLPVHSNGQCKKAVIKSCQGIRDIWPEIHTTHISTTYVCFESDCMWKLQSTIIMIFDLLMMGIKHGSITASMEPQAHTVFSAGCDQAMCEVM